jgi:hypothetical protein
MRQIYILLLSLLIALPHFSFAQSPTSVFESNACTFVHNFDASPEGFTSPSIYSNDNDVSFFWISAFGAWIEHSGLGERSASIISPVYTNLTDGMVNVGFSYFVPSGTQFRIRVISGFTGTPLDIVATTANGPDWKDLDPPNGSICLQLRDADLFIGQPIRFEFSFRTSTMLDMLFDNFTTTSMLRELPVTFLGFVAKQNADGTVKLLWNVGDEIDVVNYVAEKSSNGVDFTPIGTVMAVHNSNYSLQDNEKLLATRYYRVKNVDIDGKSKYTPIVKVVPAKQVSAQIQLYPMPAHDQVYIQHEKAPPRAMITIYTMDGKQVRTVMAIPTTYQTYINIANLPAGMYILKYDDGNGDIQSAKLIKN